MGKVRIKTFGDEALEEEQEKKQKKRKESRLAKKTAKGAHGGERVVSMAPSEEEVTKTEELQVPKEEKVEKEELKQKKKTKFLKKKSRSKRYQAVAKLVDRQKTYSLSEALELLPKLKLSNFDETVELHINTSETGVSGMLNLPHGTGKKIRVVVASDEIIKEIEKGKINFDVLLSTPDMMPKLAKVAKFLGPKGLMPNPKNGTITQKIDEAVKKFESGQVRFKTEAKSPIIHLFVGKLSFGEKKLLENINTVLKALPSGKVKNVTLKSTMSPGIKVNPQMVI